MSWFWPIYAASHLPHAIYHPMPTKRCPAYSTSHMPPSGWYLQLRKSLDLPCSSIYGGLNEIESVFPLESVLGSEEPSRLGVCYGISKKRNWFLKMDPMLRSFSTFSTNNVSKWFAFLPHASKSSMMWSHCHDISKTCLVISVNLLHWFHIGPLDFDLFDSVLNCFIDFKDILNYLIPWDIDYTQACTTPITKLRHPVKTFIRFQYVAATITSSIELNDLHVTQISTI